jgi:PHD/YefM family antitoxin component YafN of YafNO toxin-antitoxin module
MAKNAAFISSQPLSVKVPKKLAGKKVVLIEADEYARMKRRLAEMEDALGKIARGEAAYRQGRTRKIKSLSELTR